MARMQQTVQQQVQMLLLLRQSQLLHPVRSS
jgi:hypothetical protein